MYVINSGPRKAFLLKACYIKRNYVTFHFYIDYTNTLLIVKKYMLIHSRLISKTVPSTDLYDQ